MNKVASLFFLALLPASNGYSELRVEIVSAPSEVASFEPVFVVFSVENTGAMPLLVPNESKPFAGAYVLRGLDQDPLEWKQYVYADSMASHPLFSLWLAPRERWFYFVRLENELGILEGNLKVQAAVSSRGECGDRITGGRSTSSLAALHIRTSRFRNLTYETYRCWEGEARSGVLEVRVEEPAGMIQRGARAYLEKRGALLLEKSGRWRFDHHRVDPEFLRRFPSSQYSYSYLTRLGASPDEYRRAIVAQPENPLNQWARIAKGESEFRRQQNCAEGLLAGNARPELDLEMAEGGQEYLEQIRWSVRYRECPLELRLKAETKALERRADR